MIKNVVIVNDFDYIQGGASKVAIQTANMLVEKNKNLNVYFFSAVHDADTSLDKRVINICTNQGEALKNKNKIGGFINGIYNFKSKTYLKKLLKTLNSRETIIHVHGWTKALSSSIFDISFKLKFKVVVTLHDYFTACPNGGYFNYKQNEICNLRPLSCKCIKCNCDSRNYFFKMYRIVRQFVQNKIVRLNARLTDVISISDFSENVLKRTLGEQVNIHRVYNPIDLDLNVKHIDYRKNNYFLYVGRVSKEKGVDIFCKAVTEAKKNGIVVGDGSELQKLKVAFKNIKFVGWKTPNEVKQYMQKSKALIIPSRWYEGAPLTPLEALQYGIPIITSDCNASVDYINDTNGLKFKNEFELRKILEKFNDNSFNPKLISIPRKYLSNYYQEIFKIYEEIIENES